MATKMLKLVVMAAVCVSMARCGGGARAELRRERRGPLQQLGSGRAARRRPRYRVGSAQPRGRASQLAGAAAQRA
jgi:hypothetical protein